MAIKREETIKKIIGMFTRFKDKVLFENAVGYFDINKSAEPLFMNVLNRVYDLKLKDMNAIQRNFPAIDLGDEGAGICYQITSTGTQDKYNTTVKKYKEKNLDNKFKELRFLLIGDNEIKKKDTGIRTSISTLKDLIRDVSDMPDRDLAEFETYFASQMNESNNTGSILPVPLLAPNNSDSYEKFFRFHQISIEEAEDARLDINDLLKLLRELNKNQRELLYFMVANGHFPNAGSSRFKGDTQKVFISTELVYEEIGKQNHGKVRSLEERNLISYEEEYYKYSGANPITAFSLHYVNRLDFNLVAAVKDFSNEDREILYDFFVNTNTMDLA